VNALRPFGAAALAAAVTLAACSSGGPPDREAARGNDAGSRTDAYAPGWSAVHGDNTNDNFVAAPGPRDVTRAWERDFDGTINLGATVAPSGRVYLTTTAPGCHLYVLDGATGETVWCSDAVDRLAVVSSPLLDRDGRAFLADGDAMHAFDADGDLLWETPIVGVPLSAQFTPQGHVIFVTHVGQISVLRRDTGEHVLPPVELVPGATFGPADDLTACARGTAACPSANTPAVDLETGRFYFTFWEPGAAQAGLRAMRYTEDPAPALVDVWTNDTLPGGSASSPVLSADGRRVYVNDNVDSLHAVDARTGREHWSFPIGYAPGGNPSLSPDGLIMPAGGGRAAVLAVQDDGDTATAVWRQDSLANRGISTQTAGGLAYVTVAVEQRRIDLVVVDTATGAELDREPLPGVSFFTVGTTIGPDGTVYVPTIAGGFFAFHPT
jgi:outer membrane protein assembly factor BamB